MQDHRKESNCLRLNGVDASMRVNYCVCDLCGEKFDCGEGFKAQITFPVDERLKHMATRHHYRKSKTLDLCIVCGVERLGLGTETDKDVSEE